MPTYSMTGPNGQRFTMTADDSMSREDAQAELRKRIAAYTEKQSAPAVAPAQAPVAAPAPVAVAPSANTAQARLQARQPLKEVEAPGIFDYFTNREAAIKQSRERAAYMQELGQRGALEDIKTQTGFFDRLGDMFSRGLLATTSSIKDTQRAIETDPELKKQFTEEARRFAADKGVEIKGETTEDDVKKNFLRNVVPYVLEKGAESIPGMLAAAVPIPGLGLAQNFGSQARTATELEGRQDVEALDLAKAAPGALAVSALDQFGLGGILAAPAKTALGRIGKAALLEGGTEAIQSAIEYASPRVVTGSDIDAGEMFEQAAFGALAGGGIGGGIRGGVEAVSAPFRSKADKTNVDPAAVTTEFQRVAAEEVAKVMADNPGMKQNEAVKFVEENAEALFNLATANIVSGTKGGAGDSATASTGVDDLGGSGAGAATDRESLATKAGTTVAGADDDGRLDGSVSGVSVPTTGTGTGVDTLIEPTAKQVKAMVPTIEQAFEASALDFEEAYADVLNKDNKLNSQQKTLAARILVQSPEVDPYDAIGSVLDRGLETLTGKPVPKKAPSTSRTTVTGPPNAREIQDKITAAIADVNAKRAEMGATLNAQFKEQYDADMASIERGEEPKFGFGPSQQVSLNPFEAAPDVAVQETVQEAPNAEALVASLVERMQAGEISPEEAGPEVRAFLLADTLNPAKYTPQEVVENLTAFGAQESRNRGYLDNTPEGSLFREGVRDSNRDIEPLADEQILANNGPEAVTAYKEGLQWGKDTVAATQAAPVEDVAREQKKKFVTRMKKAPGKTARQKLFAIMAEEQAEDLKNNPPEDASDLEPQAEEIEGRAGLNKKRLLESQRAKYKGDPRSMTGVVAKELLQNSHDATRTAMVNGQITDGKVDFNISEDGRTIIISDNGVGMEGDLLAGPFLELGSTGKGEGTGKNSGGFGLAKALLLYGSDKIDVITANNGKISTLDTTGEALAAAAIDEGPQPRIKVRDFTPEDYQLFPDGHGSIVQLLMPDEDIDPATGNLVPVKQLPARYSEFEDILRGLTKSPLFANTEVTYNGGIVPVGANFPLQNFRVFARVGLPYGVAHIYVTKEKQQYGNYNNVHILSDGVWQFDTEIKDNNRNTLPYEMYINIIPDVKPDSAIYPFNEQRKNFSDGGGKAHQKIANLIRATYGIDTYSDSVKSFGNIQYFDPNTRTLGPVIDLTPEIPKDVLDKLSQVGVADNSEIEIGDDGRVKVNGNAVDTESVEELELALPNAKQLIIDQSKIDANGVMVHENADVEYINAEGVREQKPMMEFLRETFGAKVDDFYYYMGDAFQQLRGEVVNIMGPGYAELSTEAVGISVDPGYRGVSIKLPFSGMFINPLVPEAPAGPESLFGIITTMVHELAHFRVRSHDAGFPAEMQRIQAALEAAIYNQGFDFAAWKQQFVNRAIDAGYVDIIRAGQQLFETEKDRESYTYGNPDYKNIRVIYRGERFKDGASEQIPDRSEAGPDGTTDNGKTETGGSGEERLLDPTYESREGTGGRRESGTGEGGGEPLTDANVEEAVSVKLTKAQIKRLEAAAGIRGMEINKLQKRIIQSRNDNETKGLIKRLAEAIKNPDANSGIIASLTQSMSPTIYKAVLGFQQIDDVFRLAKLAGLKSIDKIDTIMREEYIPYVNRIVRRASAVEQEWTAFASRNPDGNTALDDSIMYSNMLDADPSLAVTAAEYMRIDPKLKELEASLATEANANKQKSLKGQITRRKDDIKRLYFGGTLKDKDGNPVLDEDKKPVVVLGWNSLPPEGRKIFKAARDFHRANFNEHYRLLMQRIDDAKFDSKDAVKLKSSIEQMFNKARERTIYFPVKRFGEHWLSVGNDFYMRESPREIKNLVNRLESEKETRPMVVGTSRETLRNKVASNDASAALKGILDALDGGNTTNSKGQPKIEEGDLKGLRDLIFQMYLTALPEADMRRRFVHRRFITGFSTDALRTFAATAVASANQLGRLAYNYKFQNVLEEAKAASESDELTPYRDALRSEISERVQSILAPETNNSVVNAINKAIAFGSKVTFYHHLSSAASAMINLTQLHTLGLPVLSGEFGEAKTAAMAARYTTSFLVGREIPNPFRDEDGNIALQAPEFKLQNSAYMRGLKKSDPDRYKQTLAAMEYAQDHDVIESTFASSAQLYERSNTPTGKFNFRQAVRRGEALTAAQRASANAMSAMGFLFHSTETIGRGIMYMSSFDLAYERAIGQGKTPEQAGMEGRKLAAELTNKAMFDFSNWNKSRFAKAPAGRLALQMTSYIHSLSSLLFRSFVGMMPFFNKEGKAAAARVFFGSAAVTALYGGIRTPQFYALTMGGYTLIKYVESLLEDDDEEEEVKQGYLNNKTIEREVMKFADENGNSLGKKDMEYYIRATFIPQTFGKESTLANALGLSDKAAANLAAAADMGIPGVFGVDISGSVAMGGLPFIWSNVQVKGDTPEVRAYEGVSKMALGPFGSVGISYVKAIDAWEKGDVQQAIELVVPAIIRNPLKALRLQEEGLLIGKDKDTPLKDPSYYTNGKATLQSLGFKDAETSRNMQLDMLAGDVEREVAAQKTELLDRRYRATLDFEKNPSEANKLKLAEVERDMDIFTLNYPSSEITLDTVEKSRKAKEQDAGDKAYGIGFDLKVPIREATQQERLEQLLRDAGK